jgi:hypothetical protein
MGAGVVERGERSSGGRGRTTVATGAGARQHSFHRGAGALGAGMGGRWWEAGARGIARRLQWGRRGQRENEEPCMGGGEILARAWSRIRREPPRLTARAWGRGTVCVGRPQAVTETRERALECGR